MLNVILVKWQKNFSGNLRFVATMNWNQLESIGINWNQLEDYLVELFMIANVCTQRAQGANRI